MQTVTLMIYYYSCNEKVTPTRSKQTIFNYIVCTDALAEYTAYTMKPNKINILQIRLIALLKHKNMHLFQSTFKNNYRIFRSTCKMNAMSDYK